MSGTVTLDGLTTTPQTVNENQWYSLADFLSYQPYESSPGLMPPGTTLLYAGGVFVDPSENLANNYWATGVANLTYPSSAYQETTYTDGTIYRYIYIDDPSFPEPSPGLGISATSLDSIKIEFIAPGITTIGALLNLQWLNTLQPPGHPITYFGDITTNLYAPITVAQTACYREGTRIRTARGDVRVEHLLEGEPAFAASGSFQDIRWIGHRHVDCHRHPRPHEVWPVRIHANAFGHGLPHRDLFLSPDHAVYIDGVLIPIRYLVNGRTIAQEPLDTVTYWHVELDRHDVILAEGLPCESYLDTGNRGAFANGGAPLALHAEPVEANEQVRREAGSCAPLATQADRVEPIWQRLAARAAELGYPVLRPAAIMDPQLRVLVGVREIKPISTTDDQYLFALPSSPTGMVQIISRAASPSDLRPWLDDRRRLGVSVARIILRNEAGVTEIPVDHPSLVDGWHDVERDGGRLWRWTDGAARLPVPSGPHRLEIRLNGSIEYPVEMAAAAQVLAA